MLDGDQQRPTQFNFPHRTFVELMLAWEGLQELAKVDLGEWEGEVDAMEPLVQAC